MLFNIGILVFVLGIAYWQGLQGFLSALLHLGLVIVAGALAFAFWEPIAMGMLGGMMPRYAWAVGLVMPFVFILLLLRFLMDKFVLGNADFSQLTNLIAGGICGAMAAVLSAGIFMIGVSYLPAGPEIVGYRPLTLEPGTGAVLRKDTLWIQVDSIAAGFFSRLSSGSLAPANGKSLTNERADFLYTSQLVRLRGDEYSSTAATPGSVTVTAHHSQPTPLETLPKLLVEGLKKQGEANIPQWITGNQHRIVTIETNWTNKDKNYDGDPRLRVFPNQVQLITFSSEKPDSQPKVHLPFAISQLKNPATNMREFTVVNHDGVVVMTDSAADAKLTFAFLVPVKETERYLMVRNLRLLLPDADKALKEPKPEQVLALIGEHIATDGTAIAGTPGTTPGTNIGDKQGGRSGLKGEDIQLTADLPRVTSKNLATEFEFTGNDIRRGDMLIKMHSGAISNANMVTKVHQPDGQAVVRVKMSRDAAQSILGQALALAGAVHPIFIEDNRGNNWQPVGYAWNMEESKNMKLRYDPQAPIKAVAELPVRQLNTKDDLYLYFLVEKGVTLINLKVGTVHTQELNRIEVP